MLSIQSYQPSYQIQQEPLTVKDLSDKLEEYNNENNENVLFIDLLENIIFKSSSQDKYKFSKDGQTLINALNKEINNLNNPGLVEYEKLLDENDKFSELNDEISKLKAELAKTTEETEKKRLELEIFKLESSLFSKF